MTEFWIAATFLSLMVWLVTLWAYVREHRAANRSLEVLEQLTKAWRADDD